MELKHTIKNSKQPSAIDTQHGIAYALLKFSLPLILSGILQQLYNWADAFIVGNIEGELALAAIGSTTTVINFYLTAITGFTLGLSILFGQKYGSGQFKDIPHILSTFCIFLGAVFLFFAAAAIFLAYPLLRLLHTTPETLPLADSYLQIVLAGIPCLAVYNVYSAALRGIGDSRTPFLAVLFSSAINVVLDILFVAFFRWGVQGAASATAISQGAMTVFLIVYATRKHTLLCFQLHWYPLNLSLLRQGVRFGLPPMIQSSISACGSLILQNFMNGFGTQTVAAITTAYRIDTIVLLPIINLGSGISTFTAQSYGAGEAKKAKKTLFVGLILMAAVSLLLTVLVIPTGGRLIALFGASEEAVGIGQNFFQRIACFYIIYGLATAVRGYLEGLGDMVYSSAAGILSLLFRITTSYGLVSLFGNMIIAYAEGFSWGVLLLLYLLRLPFRRSSKKAKPPTLHTP